MAPSLLALLCLTPVVLSGCDSKDSASAASGPKAQPVAVDLGCPQCKCKDGKAIETTAKAFQYCELVAPTTIQGYDVKAARTGFDTKGAMLSFALAKPTKIGPVVCKADGNVTLSQPGVLKGCYTTETVEIDDVPCTGSIGLHVPSGKLSRCELAKPRAFGELTIPANSWVSLYESSGKLERFEIKAPLEVQGHTCKGFTNYLHESGKLKKCNVADDVKIEGKDYKGGKDSVCFDEAGKVADCKTFSFRVTG